MESLTNEKKKDIYLSSWKIISEKVEEILNPDSMATMTFEPLYSRIYKNVCDGFSEQMHIDLISLCSNHLHSLNRNLCSHNEISVEHLLSVHKGLRSYLLSAQIISSIFSYLNKFYVVYYLSSDLFVQLTNLYSQIIISNRISALMSIVEESSKTPFSIPPEILHNFFNELHQISNGQYSEKYLHLFSKYCLNVIPPMKESDLENHMKEVNELKKKGKCCWEKGGGGERGVKRPSDESTLNGTQRKINLNYQFFQ